MLERNVIKVFTILLLKNNNIYLHAHAFGVHFREADLTSKPIYSTYWKIK